MASEMRIEYRVVGITGKGSMAGTHYAGSPRDEKKTAEREAYEARKRGNTAIRIQTRTITQTPWTDLPEEPHTDE